LKRLLLIPLIILLLCGNVYAGALMESDPLSLHLLGTAGGQTANGDTAANGDLTLEGTASVTKTSSYIYLQRTGGFVKMGPDSAYVPSTLPVLTINAGASDNNLILESDSIYGASWIFNASATGGHRFQMYSTANSNVAGGGKLYWRDLTASAFRFVLDNGNAGFGGITSPTAAVHLPAGTATANTAPLQFTSGTLETTPRAGVVEYLNGVYYGTDSAGSPARHAFLYADGDGASLTNVVHTESDPNALLTAGTDNVKDTHIDWGVGAGQVSGADFANEDLGDLSIATGVWSIDDDALNFTEIADSLTLDNNTSVAFGAYGLTFNITNPSSPAFDINGTGAFADDLLHIHQHTGNPTGGNVIHAEAEDMNVTPLVHISQSAADITGAVTSLHIDAVDNDDADWTPFQIQDDRDGTPDTLFNIDYTGTITTGIWGGTDIDISDKTNIAVTAPIVLTDDTVSISAATTDAAGSMSAADYEKLLNTISYCSLTCDGSTDDATALNSCISTLSTAGGGTVLLKKGDTCAIASTILLRDYVTLDLNGSTLKWTGAASGKMIWMPTDGYLVLWAGLKNGYLNPNSLATTMVHIDSSKYLKIENIYDTSSGTQTGLTEFLFQPTNRHLKYGSWTAASLFSIYNVGALYGNNADYGMNFIGTNTTDAISAIAINAAGTGYVAGEIVTITGGGGNAQALIGTVGGSGEVTALTVYDYGTGYSSDTNVATTGGSGSSLTVNTTVGSVHNNVTNGQIHKTYFTVTNTGLLFDQYVDSITFSDQSTMGLNANDAKCVVINDEVGNTFKGTNNIDIDNLVCWVSNISLTGITGVTLGNSLGTYIRKLAVDPWTYWETHEIFTDNYSTSHDISLYYAGGDYSIKKYIKGDLFLSYPQATSNKTAKIAIPNDLAANAVYIMPSVTTTIPTFSTMTDAKWCSFTTASGLACTETAPATHTQNTDTTIIAGDSSVIVADAGDGYVAVTEDNAEIARFTGGQLGIGVVAPAAQIDIAKDWGGTNASYFMQQLTSIDETPRYIFRRANGSLETPTQTLAAQNLGAFAWRGHDGTNWTNSIASMLAVAGENFTATNQGSMLNFYTTKAATTSAALAFKIDQYQNILIGNLSSMGTSAANTLGVKSGTCPTASHPADAATICVDDYAAGDAALKIYPETTTTTNPPIIVRGAGVHMRSPEIIKTADATLTLAEVSGTFLSNYGETDDADLILTLTDLDLYPGANFLYRIEAAMATNDTCIKAAADNAFMLDGSAGADNGCICNTAPAVGDKLTCAAFTNGASTVVIDCEGTRGTWAIVADNTGDCPN